MLEFARENTVHSAKIKVMGVGGGGSNATDYMASLGMDGVDFAVVNTDVQALSRARIRERIQIGVKITQGMGAGANPEIGRQAALEDYEVLAESLDGVDILFLVVGLGGGTGTGAAPVIAKIAKERGIIVLAVVTKPFSFEGRNRLEKAELGRQSIEEESDAVICISNNKLIEMTNEDTSLSEAFNVIDGILCDSVYSIFRLVRVPGKINVDFADIKTIMELGGEAVLTFGEGEGNDKAVRAVKAALNNPLLEGRGIKGAKGILISVIGGDDLSLFEVNKAMNIIEDMSDVNANLIFGASEDKDMKNRVFITIIATGISTGVMREDKPAQVVQKVINFEEDSVEEDDLSSQYSINVDDVDENDLDVPAFMRRRHSSVLM